MTASVLNFAEELLGVNNKAIYDGSWTEFVFSFLFFIFVCRDQFHFESIKQFKKNKNFKNLIIF